MSDLTVQTKENVINNDKSGKKYMCENCSEYYDNYKGLYNHRRKVHKHIPKKRTEDTSESTKTNVYCCPVCDREFTTKFGLYRHLKTNHVNKSNIKKNSSKPFFCDHCNTYYDFQPYYDHLKIIGVQLKDSVIVNNNIKCLECNTPFSLKSKFRKHLHEYHKLDMTPVTLTFSKIEAFYEWMGKIERESSTVFNRKVSKKTNDCLSIKFECYRSGRRYRYKYVGKSPGKSYKLGTFCTAAIYLEKNPKGIKVTYYPVHYGHGNQVKLTKLSPEERAAIDELVSRGMSFEELLSELKGTDCIDDHQVFPLKKRYESWVKSAFRCEEYDTEVDDLECVSKWVLKCSLLEKVPVLLYDQRNINRENEEFVLAIMTEFQKLIFMSSSKNVICVDTYYRKNDPHFIIISVIDELKSAFPVAYCITYDLNKDVMTEFFTCIKNSIGSLSPKYLISNYYSYIYESWVEVMGYSPIWLWGRWHIKKLVKAQLGKEIKNELLLNCELFKTMELILDCKNEDVFVCMFKNFINRLNSDKKTEIFGNWLMERLGHDSKKWAYCYQKEIECLTNFHFEILYQAFFKYSTIGKNKRLYTLIIVFMKILKNKILDRIPNSSKDLKHSLALDSINLCHDKSRTIPPEQIHSVSEKLWKIESEDSETVYVTQEIQTCLDYCSLKCKKCNICVHQFSCSCLHNMIDANLCMHIHAVVLNSCTLFNDASSPINVNINYSSDRDSSSTEDTDFIQCNTNTSPPPSSCDPKILKSVFAPVSCSSTSSKCDSPHQLNLQKCISTPSISVPEMFTHLTDSNVKNTSSPIIVKLNRNLSLDNGEISTEDQFGNLIQCTANTSFSEILPTSCTLNIPENIPAVPVTCSPTPLTPDLPLHLNFQQSILTTSSRSQIFTNSEESNANDLSSPINVELNINSSLGNREISSVVNKLNNPIQCIANTSYPETLPLYCNPNIKSIFPIQVTSSSTSFTLDSLSQFNIQNNISAPISASQMFPNLVKSSVPINTSMVFFVDISTTPKIISGTPSLNTETPFLNTTTSFLNTEAPISNSETPVLNPETNDVSRGKSYPTSVKNENFCTEYPCHQYKNICHECRVVCPKYRKGCYKYKNFCPEYFCPPAYRREAPVLNTKVPASISKMPITHTETFLARTNIPAPSTESPVSRTENNFSCTETPVLCIETPVFKTRTPILCKETPTLSTTEMSSLSKTALLKSVQVLQSIQSSTLSEEMLTRIREHLNACRSIIESSKNECLTSSILRIKAKKYRNNLSTNKYWNKRRKLLSVFKKQSHKRTAVNSRDYNRTKL